MNNSYATGFITLAFWAVALIIGALFIQGVLADNPIQSPTDQLASAFANAADPTK